MAKIEGIATEDCRIHIYDLQTNTLVIDEEITAGAYLYTGLTSYDKWVSAMKLDDGQAISYGKVTPAGEPPVEAIYDIATGGDDTGKYYTSFNASSIYLSLNPSDDNFFTLRYQLPIPNGSSIEYAYLTLQHAYYNQGTVRALSAKISVESTDNASAPTNMTQLAAVRSNFTGTTINWPDVPAGYQNGATFTTPSIVSLVQETVNRAGWVSGNHIQFAIEDLSGTGTRSWASYEHTSWGAPRLHIRFQAP